MAEPKTHNIVKRKKTDRRKLVEKTTNLAKHIAKVRDRYTCQMCGTVVDGSNCHGSHIIPVSADHRLEVHPINIKALCYHCHMNVWHKNVLESGEWYENKFPQKRQWLREQRIINNPLGTITLSWLEWWYSVLLRLKNANREEVIAWESNYIEKSIHDWVFIKEEEL